MLLQYWPLQFHVLDRGLERHDRLQRLIYLFQLLIKLLKLFIIGVKLGEQALDRMINRTLRQIIKLLHTFDGAIVLLLQITDLRLQPLLLCGDVGEPLVESFLHGNAGAVDGHVAIINLLILPTIPLINFLN